MIIKIKAADGEDGWFLFDNAEEVFCSRVGGIHLQFEVSMGKGAVQNEVAVLEDSLHANVGSFFHTGPIQDSADLGWFISFRRGEKTYQFWGDTEAYMLNDNGRTLERIF